MRLEGFEAASDLDENERLLYDVAKSGERDACPKARSELEQFSALLPFPHPAPSTHPSKSNTPFFFSTQYNRPLFSYLIMNRLFGNSKATPKPTLTDAIASVSLALPSSSSSSCSSPFSPLTSVRSLDID